MIRRKKVNRMYGRLGEGAEERRGNREVTCHSGSKQQNGSIIFMNFSAPEIYYGPLDAFDKAQKLKNSYTKANTQHTRLTYRNTLKTALSTFDVYASEDEKLTADEKSLRSCKNVRGLHTDKALEAVQEPLIQPCPSFEERQISRFRFMYVTKGEIDVQDGWSVLETPPQLNKEHPDINLLKCPCIFLVSLFLLFRGEVILDVEHPMNLLRVLSLNHFPNCLDRQVGSCKTTENFSAIELRFRGHWLIPRWSLDTKDFPKQAKSRATKPFQLIHADICGPIKPLSLGKSSYFLHFIDDYSQKIWVYFLKQKSEAFEAFEKFKALVEKESGYEIKSLRTDRGGEFTSNEFKAFYEIHGIHSPMIVPRSPQHNGVVEKKNQTILNMARTMLKSKSMPKELWAEAVACAVYLSNRSPTKSLKDVTPQEAWSGLKPNVSHLRVFGSIAYVQVPEQERSKLDDRSIKLVSIGYDEHSKGYRFFNPSNKKFMTTSDEFKLMGYCDSDYAGDIVNRKSTTGVVFFLGNNAISWCSKKQPIVTLSSCEAEYVAATAGACHAIWLRTFFKELHFEQTEATKIMLDNKSAISLAKNPVFHDRSKHIETKYHFIRQCIENMQVEVGYVKSVDQLADIFTKPLKDDIFQKLRMMIGVGNMSSLRGSVEN
ncbi:hypothetical protein RJ639_032114 [Escallonia herrerae]|uniref:Integrase catalytic domain-containing protein n=1 Tax=Escallonia herrerae TaxID=1293975 RepID=A0AA88X2B5_9ASTE|nr:hypothetical protein RJ639_032114 [Escallonia herrerae]